MNFKRGKPKNSRAGCLMCKPHKANHADNRTLQERRADERDCEVLPRLKRQTSRARGAVRIAYQRAEAKT